MAGYLPSEKARLVLGYLKEVGCVKTCQIFLQECAHLQEYNFMLKQGREFSTKISGKTLSELLDDGFVERIRSDAVQEELAQKLLQLDSLLNEIKSLTSSNRVVTFGSSRKRIASSSPGRLHGSVSLLHSSSSLLSASKSPRIAANQSVGTIATYVFTPPTACRNETANVQSTPKSDKKDRSSRTASEKSKVERQGRSSLGSGESVVELHRKVLSFSSPKSKSKQSLPPNSQTNKPCNLKTMTVNHRNNKAEGLSQSAEKIMSHKTAARRKQPHTTDFHGVVGTAKCQNIGSDLAALAKIAQAQLFLETQSTGDKSHGRDSDIDSRENDLNSDVSKRRSLGEKSSEIQSTGDQSHGRDSGIDLRVNDFSSDLSTSRPLLKKRLEKEEEAVNKKSELVSVKTENDLMSREKSAEQRASSLTINKDKKVVQCTTSSENEPNHPPAANTFFHCASDNPMSSAGRCLLPPVIQHENLAAEGARVDAVQNNPAVPQSSFQWVNENTLSSPIKNAGLMPPLSTPGKRKKPPKKRTVQACASVSHNNPPTDGTEELDKIDPAIEHLAEMIAENINKVVGHKSDSSADEKDVSSDNKSLDTILNQEPANIRDVIDMTRNDPAFDALFNIFNVDKNQFIEREYLQPIKEKEMQEHHDAAVTAGVETNEMNTPPHTPCDANDMVTELTNTGSVKKTSVESLFSAKQVPFITTPTKMSVDNMFSAQKVFVVDNAQNPNEIMVNNWTFKLGNTIPASMTGNITMLPSVTTAATASNWSNIMSSTPAPVAIRPSPSSIAAVSSAPVPSVMNFNLPPGSQRGRAPGLKTVSAKLKRKRGQLTTKDKKAPKVSLPTKQTLPIFVGQNNVMANSKFLQLNPKLPIASNPVGVAPKIAIARLPPGCKKRKKGSKNN